MKTLLAAAALALGPAWAAAGSDDPLVAGQYIEARTCDVWTGPCFANGEMNVKGRQAVVAWKVDVENAADEQEAKTLEELAKKRLSEAATKAGFQDDPDGWLTNTPFEDQYKAANDAVAKDPKLKGKVTVSFEYPTPDPPVLVGPGSECPRFVLGGGVRLTYGTPAAILVLPQRSLGRLALDMLLGDLEAARVLRPLGPQLEDGLLQLPLRPRRAAVGAADRRLEAVAERGLVAIEVGQLVVADRRGRAEERLRC